jgi:hypothetical protein
MVSFSDTGHARDAPAPGERGDTMRDHRRPRPAHGRNTPVVQRAPGKRTRTSRLPATPVQRSVAGVAPGAAPASRPMLTQGAQGPTVATLQTLLGALGESLAVDGIFGPLTRGAVVRFQSAHALAPDGIVGPLTWSALDRDGAGRPPGPDEPGPEADTPGPEADTPGPEAHSPPTEVPPGGTPPGSNLVPGTLTPDRVAHAIAENRKVQQRKQAAQPLFIHRVRHHLHLSVEHEQGKLFVGLVDERLVQAIALFQTSRFLLGLFEEPSGILTERTVQMLEAEGLNSKDSTHGATRDQLDAAIIQGDETLLRERAKLEKSLGDTSAEGRGIAGLAASQVGMVNTLDRGDGAKFGWQRIRRFYEVALPGGAAFVAQQEQHLRGANRTVPGTFSWCGIFAVWAVRSVTGRGHWDASGSASGGEQGYTRHANATIDQAQPGDIIRFTGSLAHRSVLESLERSDGKVVAVNTIDGMQDLQGVTRRTRGLGEVLDWLQTTDRPAPANAEG